MSAHHKGKFTIGKGDDQTRAGISDSGITVKDGKTPTPWLRHLRPWPWCRYGCELRHTDADGTENGTLEARPSCNRRDACGCDPD